MLTQSITDFKKEYISELAEFSQSALYGGDNDTHHYATFAYDAVWTMALALDRTELDLRSVCTCRFVCCVVVHYNVLQI